MLLPVSIIYQNTKCMKYNEIKVSVVIPVYNTEKYVRQAVESVMYQSLKELEIIVVDDGSTDKSLSIVEKLGDTDKRIQIYTQANQGQSIARNRGISHAHGEYIYFMDSDDLLEEDALELCYHKCKEEKLDFVFFDALVFFENNVENAPTLNYKHTEKLEDKIYTGQEALEIQLQNKEYTPSVCLHFIHRNVIEKHNLSFYPEIVHEDQLFTTLLYLQSTKAACIKRTFFHRRMRKDSTMTSKFAMRNIKGYLVVTEEILSFRRQTTEDKNKEMDRINDEISKIYEKKVTRQITVDEFKILYQKISEKKLEIQKEIIELNEEKKKNSNRDLKNKKSEYKKIEKIAKNFLKMEVPDNETLKKLVKRIEFDKNKKITVKLTFSEI